MTIHLPGGMILIVKNKNTTRRCVASCPEHARILPPPMQEKMDQMLGALEAVRRENEYFL